MGSCLIQTFIEAVFSRPIKKAEKRKWADHSDAEYFMFESAAGSVRLRRRATYPYTFAYVDGSWLYFGYGDQKTASRVMEQPLGKLPESIFYGEEFLCIAASCETGDCSIQRDAACTLPLFVGHQQDRLIVSNKYERTYELLDQEDLHVNDYGLAALLLGSLQDTVSLVKEIDIPIDRIRLTWLNQKYQKHYAPHGSVIQVVQHRDGDPHVFRKRLEATFDTYWQRYGSDNKVGMELSGGFDSSSIYGYYASQGHAFYPVSLVYVDTYGRDIILKKLESLRKRFGHKSHLFPMEVQQDYPLASLVNEGGRVVFPGEMLYRRSVEKEAIYLQNHGVSVVFQGHGGDELFDNVPQYEQGDYETPLFLKGREVPTYGTPAFRDFALAAFTSRERPSVPLLSYSAAVSGACSNNVYIDHDIWPVRPLADPQLYLYLQSLAIQYRMNRNIMRAYLHARGFPEAILQKSNESFDPFFVEAVTFGLTTMFTELMHDSVLAKKGLVDSAVALTDWNTIHANSPKAEDASQLFKLYCLLVTEFNVRALR